MAWERSVRWTDWNGNGLEQLSLVHDDRQAIAHSLVIGERGGQRFGLSYRLAIDLEWRVREVCAQIANGPRLHLLSDGQGQWKDADGTVLPRLAGCIDIDIAVTPFTNTLPIRRLALPVGASHTITAAYVSVPDLKVETVEQRYTRRADRRYLYEGLTTGFAAELDIDADAIVGDYPGVFRLVS